MKTIGRILVYLIVVCFCTPVVASSNNAAGISTISTKKGGGKSKGGRESKPMRPPKEKKETPNIKDRRPSNPPPGKGKRPSPKPPIRGPKDKGPRGGQPEDGNDGMGCLPDPRVEDPIYILPPEPPEIIVECYFETGYCGESEFDIDEAGVWVSSISIIVSSISLGSGGKNAAASSFGISAGSLGLLFSTSDEPRYRKANFVAGAAAIVLGLLNRK